ncbi:hypothetical protein CFIO01_08485 [Colletotrichum fioriniae PJ7]|uniref:Uncharacterized protein n=1 Tax=Colletotrichum fioriniae PJ7 TaxID=1445577 RepID=A0A010RT05_9PEZI|nr:hypothetical protein CFIO01_08485 [Colletotrichum fioriniae PJ7]
MKRLPSDAPTVSTGTIMESVFRMQAVSIFLSTMCESRVRDLPPPSQLAPNSTTSLPLAYGDQSLLPSYNRPREVTNVTGYGLARSNWELMSANLV